MKPDPIREFFLKANPNPGREGCPGAEVLRAIAANTLPATDPARLHLAACSPCFTDFRVFKESLERKILHRRRVFALVAVACLLLAFGIGAWVKTTAQQRSEKVQLAGLLTRTLDLSTYGTLRGGGEANKLEAVSLPSARVKVTLILPKLSDPGKYTISVSPSQTSARVLASGSAPANGDDHRRTVTVLLDLRHTESGSYFLATTHNDEESSYFYPLKIN